LLDGIIERIGTNSALHFTYIKGVYLCGKYSASLLYLISYLFCDETIIERILSEVLMRSLVAFFERRVKVKYDGRGDVNMRAGTSTGSGVLRKWRENAERNRARCERSKRYHFVV